MFDENVSEGRDTILYNYNHLSKKSNNDLNCDYTFTYTNIHSDGDKPITTDVTTSKEDDKGVYCFWTNKGGVGKTTSVIHLSYMLSRNKKKTMVIDFDPQLNSTMFFQSNMKQQKELYNNHNEITIRNIVESCFSNQDFTNILNQSIVNVNDYLDYIRGDLNIFNLDKDIHLAETTILSPSLRLSILSSFNRLFETLKKRYDFVILDLNPSSSVLNQLIICSSDFLIMPLTLDIYCEFSVNFVFKNIALWKKRFNQYFIENKKNNIGDVKIKGVSFNMFKMNNGKLYPTFQSKYDKILRQIIDICNLDEGKNIYIRKYNQKTDIVLGKIRQFDQLISIHNERGIPIWEITEDILREFDISSLQNYSDQIILYEKEFSIFSNNVFKK